RAAEVAKVAVAAKVMLDRNPKMLAEPVLARRQTVPDPKTSDNVRSETSGVVVFLDGVSRL
ncbi:MAG: hypothetical protein QF516_03090, partial [Pirellulaceae bacterium]|nr:hypothetical protein [Pirellulaceae bacterium]